MRVKLVHNEKNRITWFKKKIESRTLLTDTDSLVVQL